MRRYSVRRLAQLSHRRGVSKQRAELDYDGVGSELEGTAPPSLSQSRNASSSGLSSIG
jgi:hypothetical protein